MWSANRRLVSRRLRLSASSDRRETTPDRSVDNACGSSAALMTSARRSGCRWIKDLCTRAARATEEIVISELSWTSASNAWTTRWRRWSTSRRRESARAVNVMRYSLCRGHGRRAEVDGLSCSADDVDRILDGLPILGREVE